MFEKSIDIGQNGEIVVEDVSLLPKVKNISSKTIGSDIVGFKPNSELPPDYDTWKEPDIDYLKINDLSELKDYINNWFKEHPKVPKEWLQVTKIAQYSFFEKTKPASFIQIFVDSPVENFLDDIRFNHQEVGKLPITYDIKEVENILKNV
jgi:hypothetical protein